MHFNQITLISKFCFLHKVCMIDLKNMFTNAKLLTVFCIMVDKLESGYLELSFYYRIQQEFLPANYYQESCC